MRSRQAKIKTFYEGISAVLLHDHVEEVGKLNDDDRCNIAQEAINITANHFGTTTDKVEKVVYAID